MTNIVTKQLNGWIGDIRTVFTDRVKLAITVALVVLPLGLHTAGLSVVYPRQFLLLIEVGVQYLLYALVLLGLNLQYGYTGLVNFGPVLFFALGMYGTAIVAAENAYRGISFGMALPLGVIVGVLAAIAVGVLIGIATLRLRDDFLGIVTLAGAEVFYAAVLTLGFLGGGFPITNVPRVFMNMMETGRMGFLTYAMVYGGVLLLVYTVVRRLSDSPYGRTLRAVRADENLVKSVGKNPLRYKIVVFAFGSLLAGLAGSLFTLFTGAAIPSSAAIHLTMIVWVSMLIGGPGNHLGVLGGIVIVEIIQIGTRFLNTYAPIAGTNFGALRLILLGSILILIIRYKPAGLWGNPNQLARYEE